LHYLYLYFIPQQQFYYFLHPSGYGLTLRQDESPEQDRFTLNIGKGNTDFQSAWCSEQILLIKQALSQNFAFDHKAKYYGLFF
jgi:hypothetical protein